MSAQRCPNCGGLVGADADWCTQCFTRLEPEQPAPASVQAPASEPGGGPSTASVATPARSRPAAGSALEGERVVHSRGDRIVWDCPACDTENPIESLICSVCGTSFREMLKEPEEPITVDPGRAAMLSLFFPGIGHYVVGRRWEGFARGVIFTFALITGIASLAAVRSGSGGMYSMLMFGAFAIAAALYVVSTIDAGRAAGREPPLLQPRVLMYGGVGLMLATLTVVTIAATGARG